MTHKHSWVVITVITALIAGMSPGVFADTTGPQFGGVALSIDNTGGLPTADWSPLTAILPFDSLTVDATTGVFFGFFLTQTLAIFYGSMGIPAGSTIDGIEVTISASGSIPDVAGDTNFDLTFNAGVVLNNPLDIFSPTSGNEIADLYQATLTDRVYGGPNDTMQSFGNPDVDPPFDFNNEDNTPSGGMLEVVNAADFGSIVTIITGVDPTTFSVESATVEVFFTLAPVGVTSFTSDGGGVFTLTFAEGVTAVDELDIVVITTEDVTGVGSATVSATSATEYVVTVTGITGGDGLLSVRLPAGSVTSLSSSAINGATTSATETIGAGPGLPSLQVPFFQE